MATHAEAKKGMQDLIDKLNEVGPDVCPEWGGSLLILLPDLHTGWLIKMARDGSVESWPETTDEGPATGVLEMPSDTWVGIMTKKLKPMDPDVLAKMKNRKSVDAIMKVLPACM